MLMIKRQGRLGLGAAHCGLDHRAEKFRGKFLKLQEGNISSWLTASTVGLPRLFGVL